MLRAYDCHLPLIILHIPKTAGVSVREVFREWFGKGLLLHYFNELAEQMPEKYDLNTMHSKEQAIALFGHFNRMRGFGVEHYYPQAEQFITILRDPFERVISSYFYMRENKSGWKDQARIPKDELRDYLLNVKGTMLNHFPCEITLENFKEIIETQFIEIGVTEHLDESMTRISNKLDKPYESGSLSMLNVTEKTQRVPYDLKEEFMELKPLDFAVYDYVLAKYK